MEINNPLEAEKIQETDKKAEKIFDKTEEYYIFKRIPNEIKNINIRDLHLVSILMKISLTIPFLMLTFDGITNSASGSKGGIFIRVIRWLLFTFSIIDIIVSFLLFFRSFITPILIRTIIIGIKHLLILIFTLILFYYHSGIHIFCFLGIIFMLTLMFSELLYFAYSRRDKSQSDKEGISINENQDKLNENPTLGNI